MGNAVPAAVWSWTPLPDSMPKRLWYLKENRLFEKWERMMCTWITPQICVPNDVWSNDGPMLCTILWPWDWLCNNEFFKIEPSNDPGPGDPLRRLNILCPRSVVLAVKAQTLLIYEPCSKKGCKGKAEVYQGISRPESRYDKYRTRQNPLRRMSSRTY